MSDSVVTVPKPAASAPAPHAASRASSPAAQAPPPGRLGRLTGTPALLLLASIVVALLASSSAPTPLYALYQARWGFSPITTTVVFGVYALAVLGSLLTLGRLSDHLGRRPVLLAAIAGQLAALALLTTAGGVPELIAARVVQGLSTGAAIGAIGAGMLDLDRLRGAFANSLAPGIGTGVGSLFSAILVRYLPAPTHLVYLVVAGVLVLQAAGVALMRETVTRAPGALRTLLPEVRLPREVRGAFLTAAPVLFAVWALPGLYGALGPSLVAKLTGSSALVLGSAALSVLAATAAASVAVLRRTGERAVMLTGVLGLTAGVPVTLLGLDIRSTALFFAGIAISGVGFGSGFQGAIRTVVPRAAAHQRAGLLSVIYTVSYLGLGVPAVIAGFLVVHGGGLVDTAYEYGAAIVVLALLALIGLLRGTRRAGDGA